MHLLVCRKWCFLLFWVRAQRVELDRLARHHGVVYFGWSVRVLHGVRALCIIAHLGSVHTNCTPPKKKCLLKWLTVVLISKCQVRRFSRSFTIKFSLFGTYIDFHFSSFNGIVGAASHGMSTFSQPRSLMCFIWDQTFGYRDVLTLISSPSTDCVG